FVSATSSLGIHSHPSVSNASPTGSTKRSKNRSISRLKLPPHGARVLIASSFPEPLTGPGRRREVHRHCHNTTSRICLVTTRAQREGTGMPQASGASPPHDEPIADRAVACESAAYGATAVASRLPGCTRAALFEVRGGACDRTRADDAE